MFFSSSLIISVFVVVVLCSAVASAMNKFCQSPPWTEVSLCSSPLFLTATMEVFCRHCFCIS